MSQLTECHDAFEDLDLASWPGLPEDLAQPEVVEALQIPGLHRTSGPVGEPARWLGWLAAPTHRYAGGWRVWLDDDQVVCWEGLLPEDPAGFPIADLDALGAPDLRLPARLGPVVLPDGERVYADRGLALRVNPADGQLLGVIGFAPTKPSTYCSDLRPIQRAPRMLPGRVDA